jgi:hypothetical protein
MERRSDQNPRLLSHSATQVKYDEEIKKNMVNRWTDGLPVEVVTLLKSIFGANVLNNYSYVQLLDF